MRKMKKVIMIMMTAVALTAMSCGEGQNSARESGGSEGGTDNTEVAEPDTTNTETDTTSTMNQQNNGTNQGAGTDSRNQRDTIQ
jgi:hypothetical protein